MPEAISLGDYLFRDGTGFGLELVEQLAERLVIELAPDRGLDVGSDLWSCSPNARNEVAVKLNRLSRHSYQHTLGPNIRPNKPVRACRCPSQLLAYDRVWTRFDLPGCDPIGHAGTPCDGGAPTTDQKVGVSNPSERAG